jgi:hypothetical protein
MERKPDPLKNCATCGAAMERNRYNGQLEDLGVFKRRKYCSLRCANTRVTEGLTKHGYSWRARKHLKDHCEACGYRKTLHAHHVDQNQANNEPENIQTLCKHCHDFWHTAQKRTERKVAGRMPPLYSGQKNQTSDALQQGFPIGWASSRDTETRKYPCKPPSRGDCSEVNE